MNGGVVELVVKDSPSVIFNGIFDGCDQKNNDEGNGSQRGIGGAKNGENLVATKLGTSRRWDPWILTYGKYSNK